MKPKLCRNCKQSFRPRKSLQVYCNMDCYLKHTTKAKPRKCIVCKKEYKPHSGLSNIGSKYCSVVCSGIGSFKQVEKVCKECGTKFMFKPSQTKHYKGAGQYCSRECSYKGIVKTTSTKPINDKYGRSKRKADREWQKAIRDKYDCLCQRCGKYEKYIHAHHISTRSQRPDLKHDINNGITLCNSCHTWVHKNPDKSYKLGLLKRGNYELAHQS